METRLLDSEPYLSRNSNKLVNNIWFAIPKVPETFLDIGGSQIFRFGRFNELVNSH